MADEDFEKKYEIATLPLERWLLRIRKFLMPSTELVWLKTKWDILDRSDEMWLSRVREDERGKYAYVYDFFKIGKKVYLGENGTIKIDHYIAEYEFDYFPQEAIKSIKQ